MIKTGTGIELAGQISHAANDRIEKITHHSTIRVRFPFQAKLASGTYFINAGVMGIRGHEVTYLHRMIDAVAFRVEPVDQDRMTGRIDLSSAPPWIQEVTED